jgi:hypothetical protein
LRQRGNNSDNKCNGNGNGLGKGKAYEGGADGIGNDNFADLASRGMMNVDLNPLESALTKEEEERELMLLEAAAHIKMARVQRALYQAKVALVVQGAMVNKDHLGRVYTVVVDYGQNMELPVYNKRAAQMQVLF